MLSRVSAPLFETSMGMFVFVFEGNQWVLGLLVSLFWYPQSETHLHGWFFLSPQRKPAPILGHGRRDATPKHWDPGENPGYTLYRILLQWLSGVANHLIFSPRGSNERCHKSPPSASLLKVDVLAAQKHEPSVFFGRPF